MIKQYRTILADPPWQQPMSGVYTQNFRGGRQRALGYPTMSVEEIKRLPVSDFAERGAHLWLWVTNAFLQDGFEVIQAWGFKYLAPITWVKPSGTGNYFVHRTEHLLFGYKEKCEFNRDRYKPTVLFAPKPQGGNHSRKPMESYELIESISDVPRLELFARPITSLFPKQDGWDVWGNEVDSDIKIHEAVQLV